MKFLSLSVVTLLLSLASSSGSSSVRRGMTKSSSSQQQHRTRKLTVDTTWCEDRVCAIDVSEITHLEHAASVSIALGNNGPTITFQHVNNGNANDWYGEAPGATIAIVSYEYGVNGDHVSIAGVATLGDIVYQMRTDTSGQVFLIERLTGDFAEETDVIETDIERKLREDSMILPVVVPTTNVRRNDSSRRLNFDDNGGNLDIMVVWTRKAECKLSGMSDFSTCELTHETQGTMESEIQLMVAQTNTAFSTSGVTTTLRLAHAYRHTDYEESSTTSGGTMLNEALTSLRKNGDEILDDVHTQRQLHGADLVALLVDSNGGTGVAFLGPNKDYSFSVIDIDAAAPNLSFAHEVAHMLGCHHDRGTANDCTVGDDTGNYGWRDPDGAFRTIMSYNCRTGQCDQNLNTSCGRIQRFSTPDYLWEGAALGDANNNNVAVINNNKATIAGFFPSRPTDCTQDSDCDDGNSCTHDTCTFAGSCTNVNTCPTAAPTSRCPAGEDAIDIRIFTDEYPCDTTWELKDECGFNYVTQNSGAFAAQTETTTELCVPSGRYTFTIFDSYGDGIWNDNCYTVKHNTAIVGQCPTGSFQSQIHTFGSCPTTSADPPTNPPTSPPTPSPTATPTNPPTPSPTATPTNSPTPPPTATPTNRPTLPPTATPTNRPTHSPTATPTNPPTPPPTATPTNPPTPVPTNSPTEPQSCGAVDTPCQSSYDCCSGRCHNKRNVCQ